MTQWETTIQTPALVSLMVAAWRRLIGTPRPSNICPSASVDFDMTPSSTRLFWCFREHFDEQFDHSRYARFVHSWRLASPCNRRFRRRLSRRNHSQQTSLFGGPADCFRSTPAPPTVWTSEQTSQPQQQPWTLAFPCQIHSIAQLQKPVNTHPLRLKSARTCFHFGLRSCAEHTVREFNLG